jgi:hypothetical protein
MVGHRGSKSRPIRVITGPNQPLQQNGHANDGFFELQRLSPRELVAELGVR